MPFTFSHPAIVLPLTYLPKRWFSLTGLVIGSLTPDFEYFIRMKVQSNYSHTLSGLFWFDIPLGLLLAFIFHNFVRESLIDNLPTILKSRLSSFRQFNWNNHFKKNWFVIIISVLIGAISHLFWDSFTHVHGYFVEIIPMLINKIDILGMQIPIFKILQHSSTLLGGTVICFALFKLPADKKVKGEFKLKYWSVLAGLTLTIILIRFSMGLNYKAYGQIIVTGISAMLISLILTPWIIKTITSENNGLN
ncbi:DUF4184 family protein [Flavobacterium sp. SM15]|uniref:DUF4184 family protein n=1 Tax=Flavobacterium sp. SM15 TaxID=2908005 RepID=UPI001EDAA0C0|nr:DUF4184 family protein [Flavobacterium sp. SM15]MCG2611794.1 DUF4184 family protein [Flavobacterium sp. SM15]